MKVISYQKIVYLALAGLLISAPAMAAQLTGEKDAHFIPESNPRSAAGIVEAKNDLVALAAGRSDLFKDTRWDRLIQFLLPDVNVVVPGDFSDPTYPNYGFPIRLQSKDGEISTSFYRLSWKLDVKTGTITQTNFVFNSYYAPPGTPEWEKALKTMKDTGLKAQTLAVDSTQRNQVTQFLRNLVRAERIIRRHI